MPRMPRLCPPGLPQHIVQRGNNRQLCFQSDSDRMAYLHWLREATLKYQARVHAWVLMSNHVHLLLTPMVQDSLAKIMQSVGRHYVRYFNDKYERTGTLWEGRYRACLVQEDRYLLACHRYIELNPVRAGIVEDVSEYSWSSYQINALGKESSLHTPHSLYLQLGRNKSERLLNYVAMFNLKIDPSFDLNIRYALNKNLALGSEDFKKNLEDLYGKRIVPLRRGRPRK